MFTAAKLWNNDGLLIRDGLWDRMAVIVSGLCLVHCVSTIAFVAILSSAGGLLLAGNAGHADFPLSSPGSGVFGVLMTMMGQTVGFPVPRGGAQALTSAGLALHGTGR